MENPVESNEHMPVAKVLSADELLDRIYKDERTPQDPRFLSTDDGGVFAYFNIRDITGFSFHNKENRFYPLVEIGDTIVALSGLEQDPNNPQNFWISFVSVDPEFQDEGYASMVIQEIMKFAQERGVTLEPSVYSSAGEEKLKSVIAREAERAGVQLVGPRV